MRISIRNLKQWTTYLDDELTELMNRVRPLELSGAPDRNWKAELLRKIIIEWATFKGYREKPRKPKRKRGRPRKFNF